MVIPHCINYNLDQHQPAVVKSNQAIEKQTADNFYGWETELKPPGPILKVSFYQSKFRKVFGNFLKFYFSCYKSKRTRLMRDFEFLPISPVRGFWSVRQKRLMCIMFNFRRNQSQFWSLVTVKPSTDFKFELGFVIIWRRPWL